MNRVLKATKLEEIYEVLDPKPLKDPWEFDAYYIEQINKIRGTDVARLIADRLDIGFGALYYKALLMGHQGVGKSTELSRLLRVVGAKIRAIQIDVTASLDPIGFQPFDVLLVMMDEVTRQCAKSVEDGGAGKQPSESSLKEIWNWFSMEEETLKRAEEAAATLSAGIGAPPESWWAKVLGLFATLKGEMRYASTREKTVTKKRLSRLSDLVVRANMLLGECADLLKREANAEWLFIVDNLEKHGIPPQIVEDLLISYGPVFRSLQAHMVIVIPIALGYSEKRTQLPFPSSQIYTIPDIPVFDQSHKPYKLGRDIVRKALEARVAKELFAKGQLERLIVASGGNFQDLFALVIRATQQARLEKFAADRIRASDVDFAVNGLKRDYEQQLGESPYDEKPVPYGDKADLLVKIYNGDPRAKIPNAVQYSLLRAKAIQEFNGERWFGVHPLVVDILAEQGQESVKPSQGGKVPGGTK